jgi:DNA-binding CsgD family transcriptional regulator
VPEASLHGTGLLADLTAKQREVLDLLLQHKTSKDIARVLGISPHTVDQRLQFAKAKLGVRTRSEVALAYRELLSIYEHLTYEEFRIAQSAIPLNHRETNEAERLLTLVHPNRSGLREDGLAEESYRIVPEIFDGRYAILARIGAILLMTVLLIVIALGGLAMFGQLSELFSR